MHLRGKPAGRNKFVDMGAKLFEQSSITPQLRRSFGQKGARETLCFLARTTVKLPQDMGWANEPMFMRRIELHGLFSIRLKLQRFCTDERHVVKMNNVIGLTVQDLQDLAPLQTRIAGLLGDKRRQPPIRTTQAVHVYMRMTRELDLR